MNQSNLFDEMSNYFCTKKRKTTDGFTFVNENKDKSLSPRKASITSSIYLNRNDKIIGNRILGEGLSPKKNMQENKELSNSTFLLDFGQSYGYDVPYGINDKLLNESKLCDLEFLKVEYDDFSLDN